MIYLADPIFTNKFSHIYQRKLKEGYKDISTVQANCPTNISINDQY